MPSSTSSSETPGHAVHYPGADYPAKPPRGRAPLASWLLVGAIVLVVVGGLELFWRSQGHAPAVVDDMKLWACERSRVYENNPDTLVFLGTSRVLTDVSLPTLRKEYPDYAVVQLGINGQSPVATFLDLASDEDFRGIVIAEMPEHGFLESQWEDQAAYVLNYYARGTVDNFVNRRISSFFQSRLAVVNPRTSLISVIESLVDKRKLPNPTFVFTQPDRSEPTDYSLTDIAENRAFRIRKMRRAYEMNPPPRPEQWLKEAMGLEPAIERLQARGGRAVLVRFPNSDEYWEADEAHYPKAEYWDRFAARTSAVTIHFKDVPTLDGFECPDTSHIDIKDAPRFTEALAAELVRRGVIRPSPVAN